jgi:hypothetical protein
MKMSDNQKAKTRMTLDRWLEIVRPVIQDFSDRAFQERAWFNRGPEVSSPTELICNLLDDFSFDRTSQDPSFALSAEQRTACLRFAQMVRTYSRAHQGHLNEHEVIDDPDWDKIRQAAADLLKVLPS